MRPSIDEILAGVQRALEDVILPDLSSSFAKSRARMAVRMIDYTRRVLAGAAEWQATEVAGLTDLLGGIQTELRALAAADPALAPATAAAGRIESALAATADRTPADRLTALTATLDEAIGAIDDLADRTDAPALADLRRHVRTYLIESLARELALTGTRRENVAP